jgi:hypothetical protein
MRLSVDNLVPVFEDCLVDLEHFPEAVLVEGVYLTFGFDPHKLEQYRPVIEDFLRQLPDELQKDQRPGGGYSFLNATRTRYGDAWTVNFHHADILMCLGMAIGKVVMLTPRITWHLLPASFPFYQVEGR